MGTAVFKSNFDQKAALAAVLYVAQRLPHPTPHTLCKVLYFADRKHLERYGRFIFGDTYIAMKFGPVPSGVYDLLKLAGMGKLPEFQMSDGNTVVPALEPDLGELSDSDLLCLDESIELYGTMSFGMLTNLSHDAAWDTADENAEMSVELIASTLPNAEILLEYLRNPHP